MDINRLNEFITLATLLNYSKAANQLYLTQPALSRHIHDLEQTLGTQLFIRDTHNVHLTSAGELFFHEAQEIVSRYNRAITLAKEASSFSTGELRIGFLFVASQSFLSEFIVGFTSSHPKIKLTMFNDTLSNLVTGLNNGDLDFCIVTHVNKGYLIGLESSLIMKSSLYAVLHPMHIYADRKSLKISDLSGMPLINLSTETNPITSEFNRQLFKKAGAVHRVVREVPDIETGVFYASINEGAFLLPKYLLPMCNSLITLPFEDDFAFTTLNLIWKKKNPNPSISLFLDAFNTYIDNHRNQPPFK